MDDTLILDESQPEEEEQTPKCISDEMKADNNDIAELLRFEKRLTFTNKITLTKSLPVGAASAELSDFDFNELEEYENKYEFHSDPTSDFMLNIGDDKCPRFACACH
jgi:hypothetical protein